VAKANLAPANNAAFVESTGYAQMNLFPPYFHVDGVQITNIADPAGPHYFFSVPEGDYTATYVIVADATLGGVLPTFALTGGTAGAADIYPDTTVTATGPLANCMVILTQRIRVLGTVNGGSSGLVGVVNVSPRDIRPGVVIAIKSGTLELTQPQAQARRQVSSGRQSGLLSFLSHF
jgi:hypothetical protein